MSSTKAPEYEMSDAMLSGRMKVKAVNVDNAVG